jgi:hypothetical protein
VNSIVRVDDEEGGEREELLRVLEQEGEGGNIRRARSKEVVDDSNLS